MENAALRQEEVCAGTHHQQVDAAYGLCHSPFIISVPIQRAQAGKTAYDWLYGLSGLKKARISLTSASGCSRAAK
ncbi:MAG TPA: hypothetical protein VF043_34650 [Ktedonobacteraceae bacterium]